MRPLAVSVVVLLLITLGEHLTAVAMPRTFAGFFWGRSRSLFGVSMSA